MDKFPNDSDGAAEARGALAVKDAAVSLLELARRLRDVAVSGEPRDQSAMMLKSSAEVEAVVGALIERFGVASATYEALAPDEGA